MLNPRRQRHEDSHLLNTCNSPKTLTSVVALVRGCPPWTFEECFEGRRGRWRFAGDDARRPAALQGPPTSFYFAKMLSSYHIVIRLDSRPKPNGRQRGPRAMTAAATAAVPFTMTLASRLIITHSQITTCPFTMPFTKVPAFGPSMNVHGMCMTHRFSARFLWASRLAHKLEHALCLGTLGEPAAEEDDTQGEEHVVHLHQVRIVK